MSMYGDPYSWILKGELKGYSIEEHLFLLEQMPYM